MIFLALLVAVCWHLVRRLLREDSAPLALALTVSLSGLLLLALANTSADRPLIAIPALLLGAALLTRCPPAAPLCWPQLSRATSIALGAFGLLIVVYTNLYQNLFLDDDFWIHFPLQGLLRDNGLPVLHPFFREIEMNGHYGRDLLIATVSRHTGASLFHSLFWQNVLIQLSSFLTIVGLVYRGRVGGEISVVLTPAFIFCGVLVGGRTGLLDCYQNNNALAYLLTLSLFHLFELVYRHCTVSRTLAAGLALGTFALVYETHFGLMGLTLLTLLVVTQRREFAIIGVLALGLAFIQGGPITNVLKDRINPSQKVWTPGELNQHQIIKLTFPKKELFELQLAYGDYQRRSCAYNVLPDLGRLTSITPGTPYRPIWSWDVLQIHWLATLLAPLSLWILLRKPPDALGIGLWTFATFAFLVPALVHFGPIYEFEYFRWQFAAGFGFAGALGIAAGRFLEQRSRTVQRVGVVLLLLLNVLPSWLVLFPKLGQEVGPKGRLSDAFLPQNEGRWLLAHSEQLGGFDYFDLKATYELQRQAQAGQTVFVNAPNQSSWDLHFESTLTAVSGLRSVGHSLPWPQEAVGTPPFHASAPAQVFWRYPSEVLLDQLEVDWVLLRGGQPTTSTLQPWFGERYQEVWKDGDYRIYRISLIRPPHHLRGLPLTGVAAGRSALPAPSAVTLPGQVLTAELFSWQQPQDGTRWAWAFVPKGGAPEQIDLREAVTWSQGPAAAVSPPQPGDYDLLFFEWKEDGLLYFRDQRLPITVTERAGPD